MNESRADRWATNISLLLVIGAVGLYAQTQAAESSRAAARAEAALCELAANTRGNLSEDRKAKARTQKYLADVKAGKRKAVPGITANDIKEGLDSRQRSIDRQVRTVKALGGLDC